MCGGWTNEQPADKTCQLLLDKHRTEICQKYGTQDQPMTAISYKTQVVAGTNYMIHAEMQNGKHVDIKIYQPLPSAQVSAEVLEVKDHQIV